MRLFEEIPLGRARALALLITPMLLAGCSIGGAHIAPDMQAFAEQEFRSDSELETSSIDPADAWWVSLDDDVLIGLIATAFEHNADLQAATANVAAARAVFRLERTNRRPQLQVNAAIEARRLSGAAFGDEEAVFDDTGFGEVGLAAAWELDFAGRVRQLTRAALADAQEAEFLRGDTRALVAAEVARAFIAYQGAARRISVAEANLEVQRENAALVDQLYRTGFRPGFDATRARSQLFSTEASVPPLEADQAGALHRLATLTGIPSTELASRLHDRSDGIPSPPTELAIGNVGNLLKRRADVRAAESRLAAASARIGVARADYFPRVTLAGQGSLSAETLAGFGRDGSLGYSFGPRLVWAGFDIPRVKARVRTAEARRDQAYASYLQTARVALEETQTALVSYGRELARARDLSRAVAEAKLASDTARQQFERGVSPFLDVLDADRLRLELEDALATSQTRVLLAYVSVYLALGVGSASQPVNEASQPVAQLGQPCGLATSTSCGFDKRD